MRRCKQRNGVGVFGTKVVIPNCRDERWVCIDAPGGVNGRQIHLIDIQEMMG